MLQDPNLNNIRFDVLIKASESCYRLADQIDRIEQLSLDINDTNLKHLLDGAIVVEANLSASSLRGPNYKELCRHTTELQSIISILSKLELYIDNPDHFDGAIALLNYAQNLEEKYGLRVPIIETIYQQTIKHQRQLVTNLCHHLDSQKDSSQDELKSIVNKIIRCGSLDGRALRLRFLQARDRWFNDECEVKADSFDELISFFCRGLPKIFEEYRSIFSETTTPANSKLMAMSLSTDDSAREDGAIINSWLLLKTSTFILSLEIHLKSLEQSKVLTPTMIGDTMQKCYELTDWLASIGFDFGPQLRPLFLQSIISEIRCSVDKATVEFETEFTRIASKSIESLLLPVEAEILRVSSIKPEEQIPKSIGHYPVFKIYCLHIIDSMRWVQATKGLLSPIGLCLDVYGALNASLTRVMNALAVILNMDNNSNHPILSKIAISFLTEVLPFMMNYCEHIFPEKVVMSALGLSKTEFKNICASEPERVRNFRLDLRQIGNPLRGVMPALMHTIES